MNLKFYFLKHFKQYLRQSSSFLMIIIIVDLLPLLALLYWNWSAIEYLYLFTLETIILLWFAVRKMVKSKYVFAFLNKQVASVSNSISKKTNLKLGFKAPSLSWMSGGIRVFSLVGFIFLWIPFILLQLIIISGFSGDGFSLWGFVGHDAGRLNLGLFSINLMYIFLILLFLEHRYTYKSKFIGNKEYENTGLINVGLTYSIRVLIQQSIIIGIFAIVGLLHMDTFILICITLFKTFMDVTVYLINRIWGGIKNKVERRQSRVTA